MQEVKGQQKSGLTRNFKRCPIDLEGIATGTMIAIPLTLDHRIRYIDRVSFDNGVMELHWLGRFDANSAIVFRSTYEPERLWEMDREIPREMWICGQSDRGDF